MWPILILGLFLPRLVSVILYFFSDWFNGVFETWYWPVLGFIFMPYTFLWYSAVVNWYGAWGTWQIVVLVIAVIIDLSSGKSSTSKQR